MSVSDSHNLAMEFAERALMARIQGLTEESLRLSKVALDNELNAISKLEAEGRTEPTYSVLHRSAGTLALDCNKPERAREIVNKALASGPHPEIADELHELLHRITLILLPKSQPVCRTHRDVRRNSNSKARIRTLMEVA